MKPVIILHLLAHLFLHENYESVVVQAEEQNICKEDDNATCSASNTGSSPGLSTDTINVQKNLNPLKKNIKANFQNLSPYRADVHYDDGRFGAYIGTLEAIEGNLQVNSFLGHKFFVTQHGVREGLVDPETDEQYSFTVMQSEDQNDGDRWTEQRESHFVIPSHAAPSQTKCKDRYPICLQEAIRGECINNPGWMIVNCCASCEKKEGFGYLLDGNVRCTRERLNATAPAWRSGSLDALFTKWANGSKDYQQYQPIVISSPKKSFGAQYEGPWIILFDSFVNDDEIDSLLKGAKFGDGFQRSTDQGKVISESGEKEKVISSHRTSSNAWCRKECEELPAVKSVTRRIEEVTGIPQNNYESFQILKYQSGEYYKSHHDSSATKEDRVAGHRILTFFLYLNDVEEGGETHFTKLGISVKPKKGRALVWPSVLNDDPNMTDSDMYHEARTVIRGVKYAANHWIHQYDFKNANLWGCSGSFA